MSSINPKLACVPVLFERRDRQDLLVAFLQGGRLELFECISVFVPLIVEVLKNGERIAG